MAKQNFVILENITNISQQVFDDDGVIHTVPAQARFPYPEDIANLFLTERSEFVRIYTPSIIPSRKDVGEEMVWIANVTGDPEAPAKVALEEPGRSGIQVREYNHSCARMRPLEYKMHVDQKIVKDASGYDFAMNLPPVIVRLPPLETLHVPHHVAQFVLGRAASLGRELGAPIKKVRTPSHFQPNPTWEISDIWLYMEIMAADRFDTDKEKKIVDAVTPANSTLSTFKQVLEEKPGLSSELKQEVWRHVFFYLIDSRYALVPEKEFKRRKDSRVRQAQKKTEMPETVAIPDKPKRGRPRKNP